MKVTHSRAPFSYQYVLVTEGHTYIYIYIYIYVCIYIYTYIYICTQRQDISYIYIQTQCLSVTRARISNTNLATLRKARTKFRVGGLTQAECFCKVSIGHHLFPLAPNLVLRGFFKRFQVVSKIDTKFNVRCGYSSQSLLYFC